ncbi:MAG: FG-GAP repeat protein [Bacteroidota bacterium]|nr:FG-GAP repeat protein [Bacteroidota bacterium]MDP4234494.1 FG-GAP repeat protein [Bacteroidota bacterium]MDP4243856.1 FG-GAP repeat protein [Bacteroidota bacterium]MDP4289192.1 FG-GAP repeat protein [Bacteroidota bacterium]
MIIRSIRFALFASVLMFAFAAPSRAALNYYLKIEGAKGPAKIVKLIPSGGKLKGSFPIMGGGTYKLSLTNASGAGLPINSTTSATITFTSVITAHETSSGMASGKRQHQPITITKEWGSVSKGTPPQPNLGSVAIGDVNGDGMADIVISVSSADGRINKIEALTIKQ